MYTFTRAYVIERKHRGFIYGNDQVWHGKNSAERRQLLGKILENDYVDFGAQIGQNGAFIWHANYSVD